MTNGNSRWLSWFAYVSLGEGIVMAALTAAAPVGIWLGLWEFDTALQMLFGLGDDGPFVRSWGRWVAVELLVAAVAIFVLARVIGSTQGPRLASLALVGMVLSAAAYYVPAGYVPGPEIPLIHDISTDTQDPPEFVDILPLRADAPNTSVYGGGENQTPASLAAQQREAYPDIVPLTLDRSPDEVFASALSAAETLGWDVVAAVPEQGRIEATDTTLWFRFKDDIVIRIRPTSSGTVLDARSVSRVGLSDGGKNAARLREYIAALQDALRG
jgi:uncharacterized protein (DUF1499 family)